jgi:hypothetical protein
MTHDSFHKKKQSRKKLVIGTFDKFKEVVKNSRYFALKIGDNTRVCAFCQHPVCIRGSGEF